MKAATDLLIERMNGLAPRTALVLGSGLGTLVDALTDAVRIPYGDIPGFPVSAVSGHAGEFVFGRLGATPVIMLSGRVHYYERGDAAAMRPAIAILHALGVENLILTNSAGSLREDMPPGALMLITDHINFAGANPLVGEESDARFTGMTNAYDDALCGEFRQAAGALDIALHEGVYMWFSGPSFETPAEIRMARVLGADAVGMSTVPEVILARFFGLRVAAASVITNLGAGMTGGELSHQETKDMAPVGGAQLSRLIAHMLSNGQGR